MKRDPKANPGELRAAWSTKREHGCRGAELGYLRGDLVFAWGEGVGRPDGHLLSAVLASPRWRAYAPPGERPFDPSFLEELHQRGYDLTTLRFSVRKAAPAARPSAPEVGP